MPRTEQLHRWLQKEIPDFDWPLKLLAGDASFRRYYRLKAGDESFVIMDAPPEKESCSAFVAVAQSLYDLGLKVPQIFAQDLTQGFLLLSDFGDELYSDALNAATADDLYGRALHEVLRLQTADKFGDYKLPSFDDALYHREFNLFADWYVVKDKNHPLSENDRAALLKTYDKITAEIQKQPQVCVHRDYHSRNLMLLPNKEVGILDFQDAVRGPITYDALSLLRDCYVDWPEERVQNWLREFHHELLTRKRLKDPSFAQFEEQFDFVSAQRHIKCLGIFTRLLHLYERPQYMQYLPRTQNYLRMVCEKHPALAGFLTYLDN